jgi:hypothetical protein
MSNTTSPPKVVEDYEKSVSVLGDMVSKEEERLQDKKKNVDTALFTQNRMIEFNENLKKRYAAYNGIFIIVVIALVLIFVLFLLARIFPFIPTVIATSIIVAIAIIVVFYKYHDILSRWNMNYDVYNLLPPADIEKHKEIPIIASSNGSDISGASSGQCVGNSCCSADTVFQNNLCVPKSSAPSALPASLASASPSVSPTALLMSNISANPAAVQPNVITQIGYEAFSKTVQPFSNMSFTNMSATEFNKYSKYQ